MPIMQILWLILKSAKQMYILKSKSGIGDSPLTIYISLVIRLLQFHRLLTAPLIAKTL